MLPWKNPRLLHPLINKRIPGPPGILLQYEKSVIMDFCVKLQQLRKEKGMTQEQLAKELYVSRTAISKWESGRGYPSIDSLKLIAEYFGVTVDELLTGGEVLTIAQEDQKERKDRICDLTFGLLDICVALFLFLPFLGQKTDSGVLAVSLLAFDAALYVKASFLACVMLTVLYGVATLALQNMKNSFWLRYKRPFSLILNVLLVLLFTVSPQPNCAVICFVMLVIKALLVFKKG